MSLARLFSPCLFGHGDWHQARNAEGTLVRRCARCLEDLGPVLGGEMITKPLPNVTPGAPTGAVTRAVKHSAKVVGGRFT